MTGYVWSTLRCKLDANVVGRTVERLEAEHGACSPRRFVEYSRPVDSPTHDAIPPDGWDDKWAAEEWRVEHARRVIRDLRVVWQNVPQRAPAFVPIARVADQREGGYVTTLRAMSDESMRAQVLRDAMGQLMGLRRRFESLSEFKAVWDAVDEVADRVREAEQLPGS